MTLDDDFLVHFGANIDEVFSNEPIDLRHTPLPIKEFLAATLDSGESKALKLHEDQKELVDPAIKGRNCIICSPTGSGKTFCGIFIIQQHLKSCTGKKPKVVFLVPTQTLVDQQAQRIKEYLSNEKIVIKSAIGGTVGNGAMGGSDIPKARIAYRADIFVTTPGLFEGLLTRKEVEPKISITDYSLIIFDESHHINKDHPSNRIMQIYLDIKLKNEEPKNSLLPQVVGLTASLGVGKSNNLDGAVTKILKQCANADADQLCIVRRNLDSLMQRLKIPKDQIEKVAWNDLAEHPFLRTLDRVMKKIEEIVQSLLGVENEDLGNPVGEENRGDREYRTWIYLLFHNIPRMIDVNDSKRRDLYSCAMTLIIFHWTLMFAAHLPCDYALKFLQENQPKSSETFIEKLLRNFYDEVAKTNGDGSPFPANPLVKRLIEILLNAFNKNPNGRCMIFVATRDLAIKLTEFLSEEPQLKFLELNPHFMTSLNARSSVAGQNESTQNAWLQEFREGKSKVMVATTVAEEGIDIPECNLVIKYNHVTNEISMVQRKGRARAAESEAILLAWVGGKEGWVVDKEEMNFWRQELSQNAVEEICSKPDGWLRDQILPLQKIEFANREMKKQQEQAQKEMMGEKKTYALKCNKCDFFVCESTNLRIIQPHLVAVEKEIWLRTSTKPYVESVNFETMAFVSTLQCKNCQKDWGQVVKYANVYFPMVNIRALVIIDENGNRSTVKKLKQFQNEFSIVPELNENTDLLIMANALNIPSLQH